MDLESDQRGAAGIDMCCACRVDVSGGHFWWCPVRPDQYDRLVRGESGTCVAKHVRARGGVPLGGRGRVSVVRLLASLLLAAPLLNQTRRSRRWPLARQRQFVAALPLPALKQRRRCRQAVVVFVVP